MRACYGISSRQIGKTVTYGEAWQLVQAALEDTNTPLCASVAGWAYPATLIQLLQLAATIGDQSDKLMPWRMKHPHTDHPTFNDTEIEQALREIDDELIIPTR